MAQTAENHTLNTMLEGSEYATVSSIADECDKPLLKAKSHLLHASFCNVLDELTQFMPKSAVVMVPVDNGSHTIFIAHYQVNEECVRDAQEIINKLLRSGIKTQDGNFSLALRAVPYAPKQAS